MNFMPLIYIQAFVMYENPLAQSTVYRALCFKE